MLISAILGAPRFMPLPKWLTAARLETACRRVWNVGARRRTEKSGRTNPGNSPQ